MSEHVILVDAEDRPLGEADKLEAHQRNLRHRAISVLIFDSAGRMLLQKRGASKYHSASLWSNACCSHPRPGEAAAETAERRLDEEMGLAAALTPVGTTAYQCPVTNGLFENEIVHVFIGRHDGPVAPNPDEAADFAWVAPEDIRADMAGRADIYTAWFKLYSGAPWFTGPAPAQPPRPS